MRTFHSRQLVQFHSQTPHFIAYGRVLGVVLAIPREYDPTRTEDIVVIAWQNGEVSAVPTWNHRLQPVTSARILDPGYDLATLPNYFATRPTENFHHLADAVRGLRELHRRLDAAAAARHVA